MTEKAKALYLLNGYEFHPIPGHEGGRNLVYVCSLNGEKRYVLRISALGDRTEEDYLAETEFIRYLARNGAPVADVIPSVSGKLLECIEQDGNRVYISLFEYAKGMLLSDNGYRYREGAPLEEYFYNTGKAILRRLETYKTLSTDPEDYGLVHFDFCDGNYHVDLQTGDITVFDFDNCIYCWYMFDLAHLWTHGVGWYRHEPNPKKRMKYMDHYFGTILEGYRSETDVPEEMLGKLTLFIDMTIIEYVTDEFECSAREGELPEEEDIGNAAYCLIHDIPYGGFGGTRNE